MGRPHGLDGSFYVTRPLAALLSVGRTVVVGGRPVEIERRAGTDERPIVRVAGCRDREAAERLRGESVVVSALDVPALGEGEWWPHELEGCGVWDGAREVGVVREMRPLPSCEVLVVERVDGGAELLVPLVRDAVRDVDVDARRIDVSLAFLEGA